MCVYKYPHLQQCFGRQCLRVFWSFVLINHTEQERESERTESNRGYAETRWFSLFQTSPIFHFPLSHLPHPFFHSPPFTIIFSFLFLQFQPAFHHPGLPPSHFSPCPLTLLNSSFLYFHCLTNRSTFFRLFSSWSLVRLIAGTPEPC